MIRIVAAKEFTLLRRDPRVRLTAVILVLMLLVALISAVARYQDVSQERAAAQEIINEQWNNQGEKNPHAAAHYGIYAIRPVTPLSFFDTGVTAYSGVSIWLEAHRRNRPGGRPADDDTAAGRASELTGAYTLQVLLPLFIILLAFQAFAGEREQGTLRQLLGTGVPAHALLLGKALGISAAVGLVIGPVLLVALIALLFTPGGLAEFPQALLMILSYLAYGAIFLFFSLAISARLSSSQSALVALLAFWAVSSFVLPRFTSDLSRWLYPLPTSVQFERTIAEDLESGVDGISSAERINQRREQTLKLYKVEREADLPINFQGLIFSLQEELDALVYGKHFDRLHGLMASQQSLYGIVSLASPRMAVELASMEWAGTSVSSQRDFADHAEGFRREFIEVLNQDLTFNSTAGSTDYRSGPELWNQVGAYEYPGTAMGQVLSRSAPFMLVLGLWLVGSVLSAWLAVRNLKVSV